MALDPVLQRLVTKAYLNGLGDIHSFTPEQVRSYLRHPKLKVIQASYQNFITTNGLRLRCYTPSHSETESILPAVMYISANAFVLDCLDTSNDYCSLLANHLGMKLIHVAHRLAPEYPYPHYIHDCIHSIKWVAEHADLLGIQADKISLWGESSGAYIAAACTPILRDEGCAIVKHQTLFYPMVDLVNPYPSRKLYGHGYMFDQAFHDWIVNCVLSPEHDRSHPHISPLLIEDFQGLPPTTLITAEYDILRDEGEAYVQKLRAATVPTAFKRFEGMIHGFMRFYHKIPTANEALDFASAALKESLQTS